MSITGELRESVKQTCWAMTSKAKWFAIADRIDIEHERELDYVRNLASEGLAEQWNSGYDVGFASADDWLEQHEGAMAEHGWIRLPKDADGKYIHIGDMMENLREDFEPPFHHTFRVYGIQYRAYGQECTLTEDGYPSIQYRASEVRHHHEPTVEDVLREFYTLAVRGKETHADDVDDAVLAEYAAKLQLKEPRE